MPPEAATGRAGGRGALLRLVAHDRGVAAVALVLVAGLAWAWLLSQGGGSMGGEAPAMAMGAAAEVWSPAYLGAAFAMWTLMMVAMMLPAASPMILLYGRVMGAARGITALFAAAYLAVWTSFSAAAALAQALLVSTGLVSEMALALGDRRLAGGLLLLAALYQLSPLKRACLDACRSPLAFIMRLSRPGAAGAVRLGLAHGLYCLGCCWALMLLLFAGGVMNLVWIGLLALLVAAEKLAPASLRIERALAVLLAAAGLWLVVAG